MIWYIIKLVILLPLIGGMIWGSLKLSQHMQKRFMAQGTTRSVRIIETIMLSPTQKLAVLEFHGREILVATSRAGMTRLAEAPARLRVEDDADDTDFRENFREGNNFAQTLRRVER